MLEILNLLIIKFSSVKGMSDGGCRGIVLGDNQVAMSASVAVSLITHKCISLTVARLHSKNRLGHLSIRAYEEVSHSHLCLLSLQLICV